MKKVRIPPLTPEQSRRAIAQLQALYGDRALPQDEIDRQRREAERNRTAKGKGG